jgi:hypothetical protein
MYLYNTFHGKRMLQETNKRQDVIIVAIPKGKPMNKVRLRILAHGHDIVDKFQGSKGTECI